MTRRRAAILVAALAVMAIAAALWSDFRMPEAAELAERARRAGPLGAGALLALLVLQCVVAPIPSEPLMMAAGFVYGPRWGFAIAWLGVVLGATASFWLARALGRPFAQRFVRAERLDEVDAYVGSRGLGLTFAAVLAIRLVAFTSFDVVSYGCGLVAFPFPWFLVATGVGVVPKAFAFTYAGASAGSRPGWLDALILAGTIGIVLVVPLLWRSARKGRARDRNI